jgi:hypothetical protein
MIEEDRRGRSGSRDRGDRRGGDDRGGNDRRDDRRDDRGGFRDDRATGKRPREEGEEFEGSSVICFLLYFNCVY